MDFAIGKNIKYFRKQRGFTQEQLAESVDISIKYLSSLENGHVSNIGILNLDKIAKSLGIPLTTLVSEPTTEDYQVEKTPNFQLLFNYLQNLSIEEREDVSKSFLMLLKSTNRISKKRGLHK